MKKHPAFTRSAILTILVVMFISACRPAATPTPIIKTILITATFPPPTATQPPTPTSSPTPSPTPTPDLAATQAYSAGQSELQKLYEAGYITTKEWGFFALQPDVNLTRKASDSPWFNLDASPSNDFILRTDLTWAGSANSPNYSGCGFAFHIQPNGDAYLMYLSTNGYVTTSYSQGAQWNNMGRAHFGNGRESGKVNLTLIAKEHTFTVLVDDKLVKTYTGFPDRLTSGGQAYMIASTKEDSQGIQCGFGDTSLWANPVYLIGFFDPLQPGGG